MSLDSSVSSGQVPRVLEWVCVSLRRGGGFGTGVQQEMARARTSGRSRSLSHPRSLPIGILMPRVNEAASCSE